MKTMKNQFGVGDLLEEADVKGTIFASCTACMSIYAEFLSWANHPDNAGRVVKNPMEADNIVILSCQVTDLAVVNDLRTIEAYRREFPDREYYVSGCLARRFDIPFEPWLKRLENIRRDGTYIEDRTLVRFEPPFWVQGYQEKDSELADGHLFRNHYPFRIGVGCQGKCAYCTIRHTRGEPYEITATEEFDRAEDILLIADSPSAQQLVFWMERAEEKGKQIAIRNVEPHVALRVWDRIERFAEKGLLTAIHCPVQAWKSQTLLDMCRDPDVTHDLILRMSRLRGVVKATNIIRDYKGFFNDFGPIYDVFDYVSWNPYWDGKWDRQDAEDRFARYFPWTQQRAVDGSAA